MPLGYNSQVKKKKNLQSVPIQRSLATHIFPRAPSHQSSIHVFPKSLSIQPNHGQPLTIITSVGVIHTSGSLSPSKVDSRQILLELLPSGRLIFTDIFQGHLCEGYKSEVFTSGRYACIIQNLLQNSMKE